MDNEKTCSRCSSTKPHEDFNASRQNLDGRHSWCRECSKANNVARRRDPDKRRRDLAQKAAYKRTPKAKVLAKQQKARHVARHPVRTKARRVARHAVERYGLKARPCEVCSGVDDVHSHHDDYSRPLDLRWLCRTHHREYHVGWDALKPHLPAHPEALARLAKGAE